MNLKFFKLSFFLTSFLFLTGFVPLPAVLGPAITVATSGNLVKATAQLVFDNELKRKTGKSSFNYITEEVSKNNKENRFNKDFKDYPEEFIKWITKNKNYVKLVDEFKIKIFNNKIIDIENLLLHVYEIVNTINLVLIKKE